MLFEQIPTEEILFFILYGITGAVPLLAALYLLLRRGNAFAPDTIPPLRLRCWTASFFIVMSLAHVWWMLFYIYSDDLHSVGYLVLATLDCLLLFITIAGTMVAMLQDRRRPVWPALVIMIPFVALAGAFMAYPSSLLEQMTAYYILLLYVLFTGYMVVKGRLALAYHDRSDGGLAVTLAEMAITGGRGVCVALPEGDPLEVLFSEEPGAVLQVSDDKLKEVLDIFRRAGLGKDAQVIGRPTDDRRFEVYVGARHVLSTDITAIRRAWSETTYRMQALRDNPVTAREEYDNGLDEHDPGLTYHLTYNPDEKVAQNPKLKTRNTRPRVACLREQGVNGHIEMAAAFALAGFESVDVHMTDLMAGRVDLADFKGLVACGGFSYGDVLGAGSGWARSILYNDRLKAMFAAFFARKDTFALGVCNGCQMLSQLKDIIPGAEAWPRFVRNLSEQFEARTCTLEVLESPSIFFRGMAGSRLPIAVAHGEGRAVWEGPHDGVQTALRYVDGRGNATERYPFNPNGTKGGFTGFTTTDGRVTIMMPHPERGFRAAQLSYNPDVFRKDGPWMRMFRNAYAFATKKFD